MGIFDKAKDAVGDNPNQVDGGIDNAADFADNRTGGAYTGQIDSGADIANEKVGDDLGSPDEAESIPDPTGSNAPPAGSPEPPD